MLMAKLLQELKRHGKIHFEAGVSGNESGL